MEVEEMEQDTAAMSLGEDTPEVVPAADTAMDEEKMVSSAEVVGDNNISMDVDADDKTIASSTDDTKDTVDDDGDDDDDDDENDKTISPENAESLLLKATNLKEEGNQLFQGGELEKAARSYRRGVSTIKKLNQVNTGDEQVKSLLCTLQTNLSTVLFKSGKYKQSADVASQAIAVQNTATVKPYYRRAVALRKLGEWEDAKADLKMAISIDPANAACVKELAAIKREMETMKSTQKKAYAKAFSGGSLYDDKEEVAKRKRKEEALKKQKEDEVKKQRKQQWEDECVSRMAKGEEAITFEDWDTQRIEKEKKEKDAKRKEEKRRKEERRRQKKLDLDDDNDDEDELTPEECKLLRGYKKTSDGRTTSYFTRELSAEEMDIIGSTAPKRLEDTTNNVVNNNNQDNGVASKWNQAGTWEEKDTTTYCKPQLEKRLLEASVTNTSEDDGYDVVITKVESLSGHSSVAIVSGKKRYIFDFEAKLKYAIKYKDKEIAKGEVHLPDINSANEAHEMETQYSLWKKTPSDEHLEKATNLRKDLTNSLIAQVKRFVQDFNASY